MNAVEGAAGDGPATGGRVSFADVDMHGNLHNSRMLSIAETAIDETLLAAGVDLAYDPVTAESAFVVKQASVEYLAPLRYRDRYACTLRAIAVSTAMVTFTVDIHRLRQESELAATATVMWVRIGLPSQSPSRIPRDLAERMKAILAATIP